MYMRLRLTCTPQVSLPQKYGKFCFAFAISRFDLAANTVIYLRRSGIPYSALYAKQAIILKLNMNRRLANSSVSCALTAGGTDLVGFNGLVVDEGEDDDDDGCVLLDTEELDAAVTEVVVITDDDDEEGLSIGLGLEVLLPLLVLVVPIAVVRLPPAPSELARESCKSGAPACEPLFLFTRCGTTHVVGCCAAGHTSPPPCMALGTTKTKHELYCSMKMTRH